MPGVTRSRTAAALLFIFAFAANAHAQIRLDLPVQPLSQSLTAVGTLGHLNVMFDPSVVDGLQAPALKADLSADDALATLLQGTKLRAVRVDANTIRVVARPSPQHTASSGAPNPKAGYTPTTMRVADDDPPIDGRASVQPEDESGNVHPYKPAQLEEVRVTGTRIAGSGPVGSSLVTISPDDIANSGYSTIGEVVRSLPQSFGGGVNPQVVGAIGAANSQNVSSASTVNLRGLGPNSTLTLLNGHRVAYDGIASSFDISTIPLAAIERVEILTDSASALYGSDAVAGVANFILKKDYDGAQTTASYGTATRGGAAENEESQLVGSKWSGGGGLLAFEHYGQHDLYASDRSFSEEAPGPTTLLPSQGRNSVFLSAHQNITPDLSAHTEALYTRRTASVTLNYSGTEPYHNDNTTTLYSAAAGLDYRLAPEWTASLDADISAGKDAQTSYYIDTGIPGTPSNLYYGNRATSVEAKLTGPLLSLPWGSIGSAIGGGHLSQGYHDSIGTPSANRHVSYAFGELRVPLVNPDEHLAGLNSLDVSIAGRYEKYSDFGTTTNPKFGFQYSPVGGVEIRGTWGKSFRAPDLLTEYGSRQLYVYPASALGITSPEDAQLLDHEGSNPSLHPETATSWTAGLDYRPDWASHLTLGATYYDIKYLHRITTPIANVLNALTDPTYSPFVAYNPSAQVQAAILSQTTYFQNYSGAPYDPAKVAVLLENEYQNVSSQTANGVDLSADYQFAAWLGTVHLVGNATWMTLRQTLTQFSTEQTLSGYIFNPPKLRARIGANWRWTQVSASAFVNYVGSAIDNTTTTGVPVASWTTIDTQVDYDLSRLAGATSGLRIGIAVQNLLDRDPPQIGPASTLIPALRYDSTNASPLGRFVRITMQKTW